MTSSRGMDGQHAMTSGIVPVRPPSYLPHLVKLPRRFEKAALGDPKTARHRKVSLCGPPLHMRQSISDRMDDLMMAVMWVKQELICLRQNDILLKRQFLDIHNSIETLQHQENVNSLMNSIPSSSLSPSASPSSSQHSSSSSAHHIKSKQIDVSGQTNNNNNHINNLTTNMSRLSTASPSSFSLSASPSPVHSPLTFKKKRHVNGTISNLCSSQSFLFDALTARVSSSVTVLNRNNDDDDKDSDEDSDGDDVFDSNYFRPRTSSMRTSRDLAALARRRGSKDLV